MQCGSCSRPVGQCGRCLLPALVGVLDIAARAPDGGVALEAAAEAELPDAVAAPQAGEVLDVGQDVPA